MCFGGDDAPEPIPLKEVPAIEEMRGFMDEVFGLKCAFWMILPAKGNFLFKDALKERRNGR